MRLGPALLRAVGRAVTLAVVTLDPVVAAAVSPWALVAIAIGYGAEGIAMHAYYGIYTANPTSVTPFMRWVRANVFVVASPVSFLGEVLVHLAAVDTATGAVEVYGGLVLPRAALYWTGCAVALVASMIVYRQVPWCLWCARFIHGVVHTGCWALSSHPQGKLHPPCG